MDDVNVWESIPDPAGDRVDEIWPCEWEENLIKVALRRISPEVNPQQLMIFAMAALGEVPLKQVARKLDVSLMQVYVARPWVEKLFKAGELRLRRETE